MATGRVLGVRETLRDLRRLEPEIYKATMKAAKQAAKPMQQAAQAAIPSGPPLSGFDHQGRTGWSGKSRRVAVKWGGRKRGNTWPLLSLRLTNAAGEIFDMAGKGNGGDSRQGQALIENLTGRYTRPSRAMWPAAEAHTDDVTREIDRTIDRALVAYNAKLRMPMGVI